MKTRRWKNTLRSETSYEKYMETAKHIINCVDYLSDLLVRVTWENLPCGEMSVDINKENYKVVAEEKKHMFWVYAYSYRGTDYIDGELTIIHGKWNIQYTIPITRKTHAVVSVHGVEYEYPPIRMESFLFFLLNPSIERKVREVLGTKSTDFTDMLDKVKHVSQKDIRFRSTGIAPIAKKTKTTLVIEDHPNIHSLREITSYLNTADEEWLTYDVSFKYGKIYPTYTLRRGSPSENLAVLLSFLLQPEEMKYINKLIKTIMDNAAKTYVMLKASRLYK